VITHRPLAERSPRLVQLHQRAADGKATAVVGAGFHVGDGHVLTCAHVVAEILGVEASAPFDEVASDTLLARLTHVLEIMPFELEVMAEGGCPCFLTAAGT
jgi:hypothetical protein